MNVKRDIEQIEKSLATLIQDRRKQLGVTLQELADRSGLSPAFLSQAERGKTTPSLISILKLAEALQVDINYFVTPPEPGSLVRRADEPVPVEIDSPLKYYRLDGAVKNKKLTAMLIEVPPQCVVPPASRDEGEEFFYILSGELRGEVGGQVFDLGVGDSVHFGSHIGRTGGNVTDSPCRVLWVCTPPIFDI